MAKRGDKSVSIKGLSDKRNITFTFVITLAGEFLPLQIIYGGKTDRCHPKDFLQFRRKKILCIKSLRVLSALPCVFLTTRNIGLMRKRPLN